MASLPIMGLLVHIAMRTPITLDFLCVWIRPCAQKICAWSQPCTHSQMENEKLKELYTDRIKEDPDGYERALKTFEKHLDRIPKTNDAILQKAAYTFTQSALAPLSIQKRKKGSIIPVQVFHLFTVFLVSHEKYVFHKIL